MGQVNRCFGRAELALLAPGERLWKLERGIQAERKQGRILEMVMKVIKQTSTTDIRRLQLVVNHTESVVIVKLSHNEMN